VWLWGLGLVFGEAWSAGFVVSGTDGAFPDAFVSV
jgi:hypothetical protein